MSALTVSSGYARSLLEFAVGRGAGRGVLLARSGIAARALDDYDSRVPFAKYAALMRTAKTLCDDPALALHYGETANLSDVSVVGLVMRAATNIDEAFELLNRFVPLVIETENAASQPRFSLREARDGVWVVDSRMHANSFPELTESAFAELVCGTRRYGAPPFVKSLRLSHPDPGYAGEYERIFGVPAVFGADSNAFLVDRRLVAQKNVPRLEPYLFGVLSERAEALLRELRSLQSTRGRVESALIPMLHRGGVRMEALARQLGFSRKTLTRRLRDEGYTFEAVLDELRHRLALHYLGSGKVSVYETGYLVGFASPAAFSRAFRRWTGRSPRDVRNAVMSGGGETVSAARRIRRRPPRESAAIVS
jgi:AraC-like DNA-binding protein